MINRKGQKIVIIGCGNVAWHLATKLSLSSEFSVSVYNHQANPSLKAFAKQFKCTVHASLNDLVSDADYYFVCVSDKFISGVSKQIKPKKPAAIVCHTSGSAKLSDLKTKHPNKAVFYPLQTFSKSDTLDWSTIPLLLDASNVTSEVQITELANMFSKKVLILKYKERLAFHLAAVMVNNFTNALYVEASNIIPRGTSSNNFDLLKPLIKQTTDKLDRLAPIEAQTGPAKRKDKQVMKKHLVLLGKQKNIKNLYSIMSDLIQKQQEHA